MRRAYPASVSVRGIPFSRPGRALGQLLLVGLILFVQTQDGRAAVSVFGDVLPIDDPYSTDDNEGLPSGQGNFLANTIDPDNNEQVTFEGWANFDFLNPDDDENINEHVMIGTRSYGLVQIGAPTQIRFMNLVVGGITEDEENDRVLVGNGNLEISGPGALYNNDYETLPSFLVQQGIAPDQISVNPRSGDPDAATGFDMIVGQGDGVGTVSILAGARAEIHDSIILGDGAGGIGVVTVDGFGSFLGGGAAIPEIGEEEDPHITVIGRLGSGTLNITNGGQVFSEGIIGDTGTESLGAVMGGNPYLVDDAEGGTAQRPSAGGSGVGMVDGPGSRWIVGGGLQLGGFSDADEPGESFDDIEGNNVQYGSGVGDAHLTIQNSGTVHVTSPFESDITEFDTELLIGRRGILDLDTNGRMIVGSPGSQDENVVLTNDGVIRGSGRVDTGILRNRHLGQIRVGAEQRLYIAAAADFSELGGTPTIEEYPLLNYGLIEVTEGEIEFDRGEDDPQDDPPTFQPFRNAALDITDTEQITSRRTGYIESYDSVMRFRTDLSNQGIVLFSGGDNEVYGDVVNEASTIGEPMADGEFPEGQISIVGDETFVVFKEGLINGGIIDVGPHALGFTAGDFSMLGTGTLSLTLGGGDSGQDITHVEVLSDADLDGTLSVSLFQSGAIPLTPAGGDVYEIMTANFGLGGNFGSFDLPFLGGSLGWFPQNLGDRYILEVIDAAFSVGADLNGDGIVDSSDEAIWRANAGNSGAGPLLGDVNMDGLVDGSDLLIILERFGQPFGSGGGIGAVPEPASATLLAALLTTLLGIARCRRDR